MPTLATIAAIASIIGAGTGAGLSIEQAVTAPGAPKTPTSTAPAGPTPEQQAQTALAQKAAVGQQLPTIEGLTSGYANPGYYAQQGGLAAGVSGQPGGQGSAMAAVEKAFGLPPGSLTGGGGGGGGGGAPGTPTSFTPAGATNAGAFPTSEKNLSDFVNSFLRA